MSQHYASVDLVNVEENSEADMGVSLDQVIGDDSHNEPTSSTTASSTLAYIAASRQQQADDRDEEEEEEGAAEFDPLFEFTDDILEKPTNHQIQVRHNSGVWQVISSVSWPKVLRFTATYLALPFITGVMAGMGEIFANEFMYRWGWRGARPVAVGRRNGRVFPVGEKARDAADAVHELID
ncbi:hypothetical protein GGH94_002073 [Coemansia aciculifera]|uniref:Uncharacterized protein n=1 Tax=Coemansia aciculifera TaxID=417176 RepID=A0A9W8IJP5_9FUNG|nr:hypothetical protein GGH94_002073 [Coemansia aciculifera]KAJ2874545.1 hypothetical protein GGH93_002350 [Coemansia aciculifera]